MPAPAHPNCLPKILCIPGGHIFSWSLLASSSRFHRILSLTPYQFHPFCSASIQTWNSALFLHSFKKKNANLLTER